MFAERPDITILLLTYNRASGLRKAVESIYAQNFKKLELIILDNGNTPDYSEVIEDYILTKDNLRYIKFDENEVNLGKRLNQGLSISNGKYISFLMDDDILLNDSLKHMYGEITKDFDFIYGRVKSVDFITGKQVTNSYATNDWEFGKTKKVNSIHITSVMINRDLLNSIGGFHENMKRSYDLDMWNRIFKSTSKFKRIDKVISQISVNNLTSVTGINRADQSLPLTEYPLKGYWSDRKSISFLGDERKLIDQVNLRNQSWVATHDSAESDVNISWASTPENVSFIGDRYYYIDHPSLVQDSMVDWCGGIISPFNFSTDKPHHLLRPTITYDDMLSADKIYYDYQKNLKILCPKINEDNLDFIQVLLGFLADRYSAVFFHYFADVSVKDKLSDIPNVILTELQDDTYEYYKLQGIDVVLHINGDTNSYMDAYNFFLISSAIKAPLVSSPNIAFDNILSNGVDLFIADTIHNFVWNIDKSKNSSIREAMIKNMRNKTYLNFLDKVVLDKFILFLNDNHKILNSEVLGNILLEQNDSNSNVILHTGEYITQSFVVRESSFNAIQFYGSVISNKESSVRFVLKLNDVIITQKIIPNFKLKNGVNTILFDPILDSYNQTYTFTLYGEVPIFKLDYNNVVMSAGTYFSNDIPKKACLKFKILKDAYIFTP